MTMQCNDFMFIYVVSNYVQLCDHNSLTCSTVPGMINRHIITSSINNSISSIWTGHHTVTTISVIVGWVVTTLRINARNYGRLQTAVTSYIIQLICTYTVYKFTLFVCIL